MKKFLSTILAVVMVLSSMAMVVSADDSLADGIYVGTTKYDSIAAAQTAAVASNNEIIISGTVEFGYRQAISADGIHLRGINDAKIIPSASYASGSATNIKGLLNIQADNVKVTDITFDGSVYGDTISQTTDFIVLRINEGTGIELDGVTVEGSPKTLMSIGTSTTSADVTATNFYAFGEYKTIVDSATYADIDVVDGSFTMTSGVVNGFICEDTMNTFNVSAAGHYTFTYTPVLITEERVCTTPKHIADTYLNSNPSNTIKRKYMSALAENDSTTTDMLNYVAANISTMSDVANDLVDVIEDMEGLSFISSANKTRLAAYKTILETALETIAE